MQRQIVGLGSRQPPPDAPPPRHQDSPALIQGKASLALTQTAQLIKAAAARKRSGTWDPAGASTFADFCALDDAERIIRLRPRRR